MRHWISLCDQPGKEAQYATPATIEDVMKYVIEHKEEQPDKKEDSLLIFPAYNDHLRRYKRWENQVNKFSTVMIDCDFKICRDKNSIEEFRRIMKDFEFWQYETYSSIPGQPSWRAIVPLDEDLDWTKDAKIAIKHIFSRFTDDSASWFYLPQRNRIDTIFHNEGRLFPSKVLKDAIGKLVEDRLNQEREEEEKRASMELLKLRRPELFANKRKWKDPHEFQWVQDYINTRREHTGRHGLAMTLIGKMKKMMDNGWEYTKDDIHSILLEGTIKREDIERMISYCFTKKG